MTAIQNILFPVDFSPSCVAMATFVKRAASIFGARVTLVHVFDLYRHDAVQLYVRPLSEVAEEQQNLASGNLIRSSKLNFQPREPRKSSLQAIPRPELLNFPGKTDSTPFSRLPTLVPF